MPRLSCRFRLLAGATMVALTPRGAAAQQRFTIETFTKFVGVGGVELSPDGMTAVITVSRPDYDTDKTNSELCAGRDADLVAAHGRR